MVDIRSGLVAVVALFITILGSVIRIDADVTVQVKFRQFENSEGRDEAGSLCESVSRTCETYFILCVRLSGLIPTSFSGCDYKSSNKKPIASNLINFQTQATNIAKNIVFRRTHWNGNISFLMEVWDDDYIRDDKIDTFRFRHHYSPGMNGSGTEHSITLYGERATYKTTLYFTVEVSCDVHFYGSKCDKMCIGKDDISGHYRCNDAGDRVCLENWHNLPDCLTQCVPQDDDANGHYLCALNGSRVCRPNWYNLPECKTQCIPRNDSINGHFTCSSSGKIICNLGWHGENCTIFCLPHNDTINGHYNCSHTGMKLCHKNWYGPNCEDFCKPNNDELNGFYDCNNQGQKICKSNYYGNNCTVFCFADKNSTDSRYFCDNKTGAKVCLDSWTGKNCNVSRTTAQSSTILTERLTSVIFDTSSIALVGLLTSSVRTSSFSQAAIFTAHLTSTEKSQLVLSTYFPQHPEITSTQLPALHSTIGMTSWQQSISFTPKLTQRTTHQVATAATERTITKAERTTTTERTAATAHTTATTATTTRIIQPTSTYTLIPVKSSSVLVTTGSAITSKLTTRTPNNAKSEKEKSNVEWLVTTKEGKTVLIGTIFAVILLFGLVLMIYLYVRLPRKISKSREFKNLEDVPDEWKSGVETEKSFFNPLYKVPTNSFGDKMKKKRGKLEKFYSKKDPNKELKNMQVSGAFSNVCYDDDDDDKRGIIQNPLFRIRSQLYDEKDETGV